jgi:hypothetical protein
MNTQSRSSVPFFKRYGQDLYAGAFVFIIGLGAVYMGFGYQTGNLRHMGPGFFPVSVGAIIALMGVLIALGARGQVEEDAEYLPPEWRGWICIVLSIIAFIVVGKFGGLLPATFAIVFISALGDRQNTIKGAFILSVAMCVICLVVFWWALQLQFPLFTWGG